MIPCSKQMTSGSAQRSVGSTRPPERAKPLEEGEKQEYLHVFRLNPHCLLKEGVIQAAKELLEGGYIEVKSLALPSNRSNLRGTIFPPLPHGVQALRRPSLAKMARAKMPPNR